MRVKLTYQCMGTAVIDDVEEIETLHNRGTVKLDGEEYGFDADDLAVIRTEVVPDE